MIGKAMSFWRKLEERFWTGPVLKDYPIAEGRYGVGSRRVSVVLAGKDGRSQLFIRVGYKAFLSASVSFIDLDRESVLRLKAAVDDALSAMP
jgi:hypothetical protein